MKLNSITEPDENTIIPDNIGLVLTDEERQREKVKQETVQYLQGLFNGEFYAGDTGELKKSARETDISESELHDAVLQSLKTRQGNTSAHDQTPEGAPEKTPNVPKTPTINDALTNLNPRNAQKLREQLGSGKAYRLKNGEKRSIQIKQEPEGVSAKVWIFKDGKWEETKETMDLSKIKYRRWESVEKATKNSQNNDLIKIGGEYTYRHKTGKVIKITILSKENGKYKIQHKNETLEIPENDLLVCAERSIENGEEKPNYENIMLSKRMPAAATSSNADAAMEGGEAKGRDADKGKTSRATSGPTEAPAVAAPKAPETLQETFNALPDSEQKGLAEQAGITPEQLKKAAEVLGKRFPQAPATAPATATPSGPAAAPETPEGPGFWSRNWTRVKGWLGKLKNLWPWGRKKGEKEEEEKEEPEERKIRSKKKPEGTTKEKPERAEYAWLDLNTATQRTIDALKELKIKKVAWTQKGTNGGSMTYFGVLPFPLVSVKDSRGRECIKMVTTHEESANGELKEAVKTFLIPLAKKKGGSPDTTTNTAQPDAQKKESSDVTSSSHHSS